MSGLKAFIALFIFRYLRTVVSIFAYATYKPKPVLEKPTYTSDDVSVIIPTTFKTPDEIAHCVQRILGNRPAAIFMVTANINVPLVESLVAIHTSTSTITVLGVDELNKRNQILKAMPLIKTKITVLADDDVFWPDNYLEYLLAIFEDPGVGAGGTRQRVRRNENPGSWNFLGISYLERRVWNNCATNAIDGSISTLSGRTAAYRTDVIQKDEFYHYFTHDTWRGKPLNSDDDKCLTRWVYSNGHKIVLQFDSRAVIETTVEGDIKYLSQCMRWARAHWRGNFTVMENEQYWRSLRYIWGLYYIYISQFQTPALLIDGLLFFFLHLALEDATLTTARIAYVVLAIWIIFTKNLKMIPHFRKYPQDLKFVPIGIVFSYFHGLINLWALFTMKTTHWGSQNLTSLQQSRADDAEVIPLLKNTIDEPTLGHDMIGDDYFAAEQTS
ncbi:glycosyltransferase family 2 protein [Zasmidium cellare ATCC 36951]|uniref:Glycosyltransferase family 2 protein n=1 Tax=Zasmidium cellare ATCC 36951 TaxID=1080233 RepID=A0A6A6CL09_ZASCE|nr:glycosyltransferase family 2 protein [Zasmidium cellare ATCC 36951]KAF2167927.1 glycosyltransferase family 2 protein [Zasmidium cellare ATCC 36951]